MADRRANDGDAEPFIVAETPFVKPKGPPGRKRSGCRRCGFWGVEDRPAPESRLTSVPEGLRIGRITGFLNLVATVERITCRKMHMRMFGA